MTSARTTADSVSAPLPLAPPPATEGVAGAVRGDRPHLPALDGLRGCAILLVLLYHFSGELHHPVTLAAGAIHKVLSIGWIGVDLFFVLSGFLITGILLGSRGAPNYFRAFYMRRVLRILPLYYGYLAAVFLLPRLLGSPTWITPARDQAWYWLHLQNLHPTSSAIFPFLGDLWSLAIEEQFYIVWPLLVLLVEGKTLRRVIVAALLGAISFRVVGALTLESVQPLYFWTPGRVDGLLLGAFVASIALDREWMTRASRWAGPAAAIAAAYLAGCMVRARWLDPGDLAIVIVGYSALALLFTAVLVRVLTRPSVARWFTPAWLRFFGQYSYGLYVLHRPCIELLRLAGFTADGIARGVGFEVAGMLLYMSALMLVSIVAALLSWRLLEQPFLDLKRFFVPSRAPLASG